MTEELASSVLLEEVDQDGICLLTINRPRAMNSLNGELVSELHRRFSDLDQRDDVRVIILTAAGDRAFCVGADLKERKTMSEADVARRLRHYRETFRALEHVSKPVICAINGYALGGGLETALACDLRVMAAEALVGLTETRLGIIPGAGGTQRLPRVVGLAKAMELVFTAKKLEATEALALGLVNRVAPRSDLIQTCRELALEIAKAAPLALTQAKRAMSRGMETDLETGLEIEGECYAVTLGSEDRLEGLAAFAEKRDPVWKGR